MSYAHRKPTKKNEVDSWVHEASGTTLRIYYDAANEDFWCRVGAEVVSAPKRSGCRAKATTLANETLHDESRWRRVIFMNVEAPRSQVTCHGNGILVEAHKSPRVGFAMQRSWVMDAVVNGEPRRYTREWRRFMVSDGDPLRFESQRARHDVCPLSVMVTDWQNRGYEAVIEIPYTEETWQSLLSMSQALGAVRERLASMAQAPEFHAALAAGTATLFLGAPET